MLLLGREEERKKRMLYIYARFIFISLFRAYHVYLMDNVHSA